MMNDVISKIGDGVSINSVS